MVGRACRGVRGWVHGHPMTAGFVLLFVYVTLIAGYAYKHLADNDSQFCMGDAQRIVDKRVQIAQTEEYLATSAGQEPSGLNMFIRSTSLPRLRIEVASDQETLADSCRDEYDRLAAEAREQDLLTP